jgi:hypothetical protein
MQKIEEGQGRQAKEVYVPPLQEVPLQEASSSRTGQMHVEQEIQELPVQINLWQAQSGIPTMPQILCRVRQVCKQGNESGDNWQCAGTLEEGENKKDKWIIVTFNSKTKTFTQSWTQTQIA